jgi:antitoxin (DNA-binding transcriptional repressor) of toxin-antitoxin stability system
MRTRILVVASRLNVADQNSVAKSSTSFAKAGIELSIAGKDTRRMKHVPVSKFKANCSALIKQIQKTKQSIQITRRGKVIAEIRPMPSGKRANWLGSMKGRSKLKVISSRRSLIWTILKPFKTKSKVPDTPSNPASYSSTQILIFRTGTKIAAESQRLCYVFFRKLNPVAEKPVEIG